MLIKSVIQDKNTGYGVDVLRWWAASKCAVTNVGIGPNIIRQCNDKMLQVCADIYMGVCVYCGYSLNGHNVC